MGPNPGRKQREVSEEGVVDHFIVHKNTSHCGVHLKLI